MKRKIIPKYNIISAIYVLIELKSFLYKQAQLKRSIFFFNISEIHKHTKI